MGVEIDVTYEGDLHCLAIHRPSGNTLMTDAPVDNGGRGEAFSPTDLVATALGACLVTVMGLYANRQNMNLSGTRVHVVKEMVSDPVRRIGSLIVTVTLPKGYNFTEAQISALKQAASLCPVKQSLNPDVHVAMNFLNAE